MLTARLNTKDRTCVAGEEHLPCTTSQRCTWGASTHSLYACHGLRQHPRGSLLIAAPHEHNTLHRVGCDAQVAHDARKVTLENLRNFKRLAIFFNLNVVKIWDPLGLRNLNIILNKFRGKTRHVIPKDILIPC